MANRRVPKFSLNNCAQSPKRTFMSPKFRTNPVLMYTKYHISTNLSNFLKLCLLYCQKYLPLLQHIADSLKKIGLMGTLVWIIIHYSKNCLFTQPDQTTRFQASFSRLSFMPEMQFCILSTYKICINNLQTSLNWLSLCKHSTSTEYNVTLK